MSLAKKIIAEIQQESISTQKVLERIPTDKFDWKPHEKSMSLKELAVHVVEISGLISLVITKPELDFSVEKKPLEINSTEELVDFYKKLKQKSIEALENVKAEELNEIWVMRNGEHIIMELPKKEVIKIMALNHAYHHRGQLSVYLRLLDIPVPSIYGPSADEA